MENTYFLFCVLLPPRISRIRLMISISLMSTRTNHRSRKKNLSHSEHHKVFKWFSRNLISIKIAVPDWVLFCGSMRIRGVNSKTMTFSWQTKKNNSEWIKLIWPKLKIEISLFWKYLYRHWTKFFSLDLKYYEFVGSNEVNCAANEWRLFRIVFSFSFRHCRVGRPVSRYFKHWKWMRSMWQCGEFICSIPFIETL